MLRSKQQAVYQPKNDGHFGLALNEYAHFTSPIRRYPDLLVHRAIKHVLARIDTDSYRYTHEQMQALGENCSMTERRADEATRDVVSWLKCEYMLDHVGSEFPGVIAAVTSFGLFVDLTGIHIEGLILITNLSRDYYRFEQAQHALLGERTGRQYRLGDAITVRVVAVNLEDRKIDFAEVDVTEPAQPQAARADNHRHKSNTKKQKHQARSRRQSETRQADSNIVEVNQDASARTAHPNTKSKADTKASREGEGSAWG